MKRNSLQIAFCLLSIPRLFVSLLFWPFLFGITCAFVQIAVSAAYIKFVEEKPKDFIERVNAPDEFDEYVKGFIFKNKVMPSQTKVCRWVDNKLPENCELKPLDITINTNDILNYDIAENYNLYNGFAERIHVCNECDSDINILSQNKNITKLKSINSILLIGLVQTNTQKKLLENFVNYKTDSEKIKSLTGTMLFYPPGFKEPINISKTTVVMIMIINCSITIIVALWLLILGHRKVLQYFSRNDVLLPLVAATGKKQFYAAMWHITFIRVGFFILAALPSTIVIYRVMIPRDILLIFTGTSIDFLTWIFSIVSSLGLVTLVCSIAELKHRSAVSSVIYKLIPPMIFLCGSILWFATIFINGELSAILQKIITVIPILGLAPIILSPLFKVHYIYKIIHFLICIPLILYVLKKNINWFAAHLEEV